MKYAMNPAPFLKNKKSTPKIMLNLTASLVVVWIASIVYYFNIGNDYGVKAILIVVTSLIATLFSDVLVALLRSKGKVKVDENSSYGVILVAYLKYLGDFIFYNYSYVTAIIFALIVPIGTPYYVVIVGALFSTLIAKHLFGGFGGNVVNPAAVGRIVVGLSFAASLVSYLNGNPNIPGVGANGATPIGIVNNTFQWFIKGGESISQAFASGKLPVDSIWSLFLGFHGGAIGETFTLLLIAVGIWLIITKVIDWRFPVFYIGTVATVAFFVGLANGLNPLEYAALHIGLGGLVFGAIFMLTDPVTTPTTRYGTILASILAGFLTFLIRVKGGYPEGVIFSIALVNVITPLIDRSIAGRTISNLTRKWSIVAASLVVAILFNTALTYPYPVVTTDSTTPSTVPTTVIEGAPTQTLQLTGAYLNDMVFTVTTDGGVGSQLTLKVAVDFAKQKIDKVEVVHEEEGVGSVLLQAGNAFADKYINLTTPLTFAELAEFTFETTQAGPVNETFDALIATSQKTGKAVILALKAAVAEPTRLGYDVKKLPKYTFELKSETAGVKVIRVTVLSSFHNASEGDACGLTHDEACSDYILEVSVNLNDKTITHVKVIQQSETPTYGSDLITKPGAFYNEFINFTNPITIDRLNSFNFFYISGKPVNHTEDLTEIKELSKVPSTTNSASVTGKSTVLALRAAVDYAVKGGN